MNTLFVLMLIYLLGVGFWIILRDKKLRLLYLKWAVAISVILLILYFFIFGFTQEYLENVGGILIFSIIVSLLASFIHKWILEKKRVKND